MINTRSLDGEGAAFGEEEEEEEEEEEVVVVVVVVVVVEDGEEEALRSAVPASRELVARREEIGTACGTSFSAEDNDLLTIPLFGGIPLFAGSEVSSLLVG